MRSVVICFVEKEKMTWFQSEDVRVKMSGSGDMKSSGDMTKASSVGLLYLLFNQVEIASVVLTKAFSVDLL